MPYTLYGSPHSLPTYKVALMLRMSGLPFKFRYVSFQKGEHLQPEFLELSRWGQVPVLVDGDRRLLQSAAIVEYLSQAAGTFGNGETNVGLDIREWVYWDNDVLFPPIFACYGVRLGEKKLLPIEVKPAIAQYHRQRAEYGLATLDAHLNADGYLCSASPTIADLLCHCDVAFAEICEFDIDLYPTIAAWSRRFKSLANYAAPFDLLAMEDASFS